MKIHHDEGARWWMFIILKISLPSIEWFLIIVHKLKECFSFSAHSDWHHHLPKHQSCWRRCRSQRSGGVLYRGRRWQEAGDWLRYRHRPDHHSRWLRVLCHQPAPPGSGHRQQNPRLWKNAEISCDYRCFCKYKLLIISSSNNYIKEKRQHFDKKLSYHLGMMFCPLLFSTDMTCG